MCVEVCIYEYINLKSHSYTSQEQADLWITSNRNLNVVQQHTAVMTTYTKPF